MPTCDIIIPTWNQLKETKACIDSVKENTTFPYRLIIIDNASNEPARKYLESLKRNPSTRALEGPRSGFRSSGKPGELHFPGMILERNEKNQGFVRAVNKGIARSEAEYVCLLNNDTIVTKGWLSEMASVAESAAEIGVVNPSSNSLGQKPGPGESIRELSEKLKANKGKYVDLGTALGFCMLIKRKVIERIGIFDEVFDMGNFEDTDFCLRAKREGFKIVRAAGSYVYHREKVSFKLLKGNKKRFDKNKEIFEERWGRQRRILFVLAKIDMLNANYLRQIQKEVEHNNWIYIASKSGSVNVKEHSRVINYDFREYFTLKVLLKILFKKKGFDEIYCDNEKFSRFLEFIKPLHRAIGYEIKE